MIHSTTKMEKGSTLTMTVKSVGAPEKGKFNVEYPLLGIIGSDADAKLFVRQDVLDRQCERKGLKAADLAGKVIELFKTAEGYINLEKVTAATGYEDQQADEQDFVEKTTGNATTARTAVAPARASAFDRVRNIALYQECLSDAEEALAPVFSGESGYDAGIVKDVATAFWIQRYKTGAV